MRFYSKANNITFTSQGPSVGPGNPDFDNVRVDTMSSQSRISHDFTGHNCKLIIYTKTICSHWDHMAFVSDNPWTLTKSLYKYNLAAFIFHLSFNTSKYNNICPPQSSHGYIAGYSHQDGCQFQIVLLSKCKGKYLPTHLHTQPP